MQRAPTRLFGKALIAAVAFWLSCSLALAQSGGAVLQADAWPALASQIFHNRPLRDGNAVLAIDAPYRADDAALVPVTIRSLLPPNDPRRIRRITLVIDVNPSPLAAVFVLGKDSGIDSISTRVRIDDYTHVHAVAELSDGSLYAVERFVKAAGGCSAPAVKQTAGDVPLGTMRLRQFSAAAGTRTDDPREAELMIRHPNYSGMQMDQLSRLYIPAHFIQSVTIWQGEQQLLHIDSGISISENPAFRFDYRRNGATMFRAKATDNKGQSFSGEWPEAGATPSG
ncbi:MAG: quinoprotein dehydrogenase-associated SoxYZ-like carrier [Acetobacteraceae bacterium]